MHFPIKGFSQPLNDKIPDQIKNNIHSKIDSAIYLLYLPQTNLANNMTQNVCSQLINLCCFLTWCDQFLNQCLYNNFVCLKKKKLKNSESCYKFLRHSPFSWSIKGFKILSFEKKKERTTVGALPALLSSQFMKWYIPLLHQHHPEVQSGAESRMSRCVEWTWTWCMMPSPATQQTKLSHVWTWT